MPYQCANCHGIFLKTLEIRIHAEGNAVLYKKRCKRCKFKYVLRKTSLQGALQPASVMEWKNARKPDTATGLLPTGSRMIVSEYTQRISRASEPPLTYLRQIQRAVCQGPERSL
jgi:hypothetical protein